MPKTSRSDRSRKLETGKGRCTGCGKPCWTAYCEKCAPSAVRYQYGKVAFLMAQSYEEYTSPKVDKEWGNKNRWSTEVCGVY